MKKTFVKPLAYKYEINTRENIVSSIKFQDGTFSVQFHTIHTDPADEHTIWDEKQGCYAILNEEYPIPVGPYTTVSYQNNYTIQNVMSSYDTFNRWYVDVSNVSSGITSCHD